MGVTVTTAVLSIAVGGGNGGNRLPSLRHRSHCVGLLLGVLRLQLFQPRVSLTQLGVEVLELVFLRLDGVLSGTQDRSANAAL